MKTKLWRSNPFKVGRVGKEGKNIVHLQR
jgi:hypothetical protein